LKKEAVPIYEMSDSELTIAKGQIQHESRVDRRKATASISSFDAIPPEEISWVWPKRIASGKLTIFAGDPGVGKSQATLDVAARLSKGIPFPDGAKSELGDTLILTSEDDPGDTIRPRLDALDADLSRIHFFKCKMTAANIEGFPSLGEIDVFKDAIDQISAKGGKLRLLIVDPLESYLEGVDTHKNAEVRSALMPIISLARKLRFAVLGVQHLNKGTGPVVYKVSGSIAFSALARAVWIFGKDPEDRNRYLMLSLKNNLAKDTFGLEYKISSGENGAPRICWGNAVDLDVRKVFSQEQSRRSTKTYAPEQEKAVRYMRTKLPEDVCSTDIAVALGKSEQSTGNILHTLERKEIVEHTRYGHWKLLERGNKENGTETSETAET